MDRLDTLMLFTRIVETGSFTRAAEMLDMPRPTATNAIKDLVSWVESSLKNKTDAMGVRRGAKRSKAGCLASICNEGWRSFHRFYSTNFQLGTLETRLGARLLERTTRQVRATHDGLAYYERCVHILSELDDADASLRHVAANPRGSLRVDMSGTHAMKVVLPGINDFRSRYPNIDLVISSGDRLVDLVREGVDCVIRAGTLRDSNLIARPLAVMPQVLCASPEYLASFGTPEHPDDLQGHQMVKFFASSGAIDYPLTLIVDGVAEDFSLAGWISVNDAENYVLCALRGCGIVQLPRFHVEDDLRAGRLVELLPEWPSPSMQLSALYPYRRQLSPRVRVFVDWLGQLYERRFGATTTAR